jgi:hypothetical protein
VIKYDAVLAAAAHSAIPAIVEIALKQAREVSEDMIQALYRSQHRPSDYAQPVLTDKKEMEKVEENKEKGMGETKEREIERDIERDKDDARSVCSIQTTNMLNVSSQLILLHCVNHPLHLHHSHFHDCPPTEVFLFYALSSLCYCTLTLLSYPVLTGERPAVCDRRRHPIAH